MAKKIIIDTRLLSKGGSSGIEEYTRNLVSKILEIDQENEYALFYNGFRKVSLPESWSASPNVQIISKNIPNKIFDLSSRFLHRPKVENLCEKGDVVFSPHFNILSTNLPHIVTFHDLSFLHYPDFFPWRKRFWHWSQNCERQAKKASKIIAVSEFTKSDLMDFYKIPEEKIKVIYSGINSDFKKVNAEDSRIRDMREKYNFKNPFILHLGTVEPRKNIPLIIRAFNLLKKDNNFNELELVIAGGIGWLSRETLREARESPYQKSIRFLGPIPSEERVYIYNLASVFVYPSFFEGFGFPPLEAQACGVPVIASDRTSLPEILGDSAKLLSPWKIDELSESIKEILTNNNLRESLILKGYENSAKFTWEKAARETMGIFEDII